MGERGRVLLVRGPSVGGIRRHVDALAAALPGHGWTATTLAAVGRLHPQKGPDVLLDAVPVLVARVPDVAVVIVGEGPLERHLRRRIAGTPGLAGRVHLAGPTTDAGAALVAADVVAVPSLWE